jgi:hypothetical protein
MTRYILILLLTALIARADLHFSRPAVPPTADDVVAFANGPSFDFRLPREDFIAFLRNARSYTVLPPDLQKRGEAGELGFLSEDERSDGKGGKERVQLFYDLHGVFTDKSGTVYFWQAIGPRIIVAATEDGHGCYYYLDEKKGSNLEIRSKH